MGLSVVVAIIIYKIDKKSLAKEAEAIRINKEKELARQRELEEKRNDEKRQKMENILKADMATIDKMTGAEFEAFVCALYNKLGYEAEQTKLSGDFGADIVARSNASTYIIQTKRSVNKISVSAIQEVAAAKSYYRANGCAVVTNNYFTAPAIKLAKTNNVDLVDRDELAKTIVSSQAISQPVKTSVEDLEAELAIAELDMDVSKESVNTTNYTTFLYSYYALINKLLFSGKVDEAYQKAVTILSLDYKNKTAIDLHFYLIRLIDAFYKQRELYPQIIDYTINFCKRDIELLPLLFELKGCHNPAITKLCVIYERQGKLKEAIELCDLATKYEMMDNNLIPFTRRKLKLEKKLAQQENSGLK